MSRQNPKRQLFELFASVAKALAHAHRLELLEYVAQGERSVEDLAELAGLSVANASQHLQQLRRSGLADSRKQGKRVFYRVADETVVELLASLRSVAERRLAEVDRVVDGYFRDRDSFEPVTWSELIERDREGSVTVLDVRPAEEFVQGHLPGAINVPLGQLEQRLNEFGPDREVVAYCRGPYCVLAFEAVAVLRRHGFKARRLEDGFPEWKAAGLPVEKASMETGAQ